MGAGLSPEAILILAGIAIAYFLGQEALHGLQWVASHLPAAGHAMIHVLSFGKK